MAALDGDVLIHKYELFNDMAVALAELQAGLRDRMTPKDILEMILEAEPVDPVKHGRWIIDTKFGADVMSGGRIVICSECGRGIFWGKQNYCPHCGAKMDEVSE